MPRSWRSIYALALSAVGLRYGLLVGLATGFMAFIPFVGWALGLLTATALAVVQFWPEAVPILGVIGVFAGGRRSMRASSAPTSSDQKSACIRCG